MATENPTLSALEEQVSPVVAEDAQTTPEVVETAAQTETSEEAPEVDFADEEAALAAQDAGLELDEETAEEAAAVGAAEELFAGLTKTEMLDRFAAMLEERPVQTLRRAVEELKVAFYRIRRAEVEAARRSFVEHGGAEEQFVAPTDEAESRLKELFRLYRQRRDAFIANLDQEKEQNLKLKLAIIEELKELIGSDETLNHTFAKFRELQQRWKETGLVPQAHVKDLWETYNLHVENFYAFIKINKELRDLDLKKNYELKVSLCEQAEALVLEPSVVEAFHKLQKLHDEWRETGPVAGEFKESLWERFKAASSRINKAHQDHFETLKAEQVKNLELKTELCVAAEELSTQPLTTRKEWNKASERLLEIQKTWKTIGFAPKKDNNRIYERFREACNRFFELKRGFYADVKSEMEQNLQLKQELCAQAEALSQSEDWKKTTDELIALQARWKEVGAVSRRHSDQIWKRFRAACDAFFERKAAHFASVDDAHTQNLTQKLALLEEMEAADVKAGGYEVIRNFQRRWGEIGFVPIKQKDAIQKRYKAAVDRLFEALRGSERDRSMGRFREKLSAMKGGGERRMQNERERLYNKVRQLEQEIALLENNIGFFSKSKNAEALIADVKSKIERAREEMQSTIEKVKLIDQAAE
ncbi:MAG: DUF349 domain-containing protein [Alistipes sp.]|nr:DUF349 domain-containing protein [Rikenellaceae bacterium]MBQ6881327.1 DUF349 domain-containing protein [Alistipes sp.]MBR1994872.1 DUF349 domain-containing protein [Alistipes sp.]MBR3846103.1 DUF349 domain-containing protein [Alistipes sp.]